jgi:hypothetical protein
MHVRLWNAIQLRENPRWTINRYGRSCQHVEDTMGPIFIQLHTRAQVNLSIEDLRIFF